MWTEIKPWISVNYLLSKFCKGVYQKDLILGFENLSGSTLKGRAAKYGGRYATSRDNLLKRMSDAGIPITERHGENNKRILVIG